MSLGQLKLCILDRGGVHAVVNSMWTEAQLFLFKTTDTNTAFEFSCLHSPDGCFYP